MASLSSLSQAVQQRIAGVEIGDARQRVIVQRRCA
jgi:hypothetical protein